MSCFFFYFFRSFILSRPSRRKLKQSGILKERVFGCDLGEHLLNSGRESEFHHLIILLLPFLVVNSFSRVYRLKFFYLSLPTTCLADRCTRNTILSSLCFFSPVVHSLKETGFPFAVVVVVTAAAEFVFFFY